MSGMKIQECEIKSLEGRIYAKTWIPENRSSEVPIVLLHDSLGCVELWRDFPEVLAQNLSRRVIAYDRLGFGKSDARLDLPGFNFIEEEAIKYFPVVKRELSLTQYVLCGHSVGGAMAIHIAARDAQCVAVITMAAQAFVEDLTVAGIMEAKQAFNLPEQIERLERWHGQKAQWVLRAWTEIWLAAGFSGWSLEDSIGKVICPVLAIHGDRDEYGSTAFPEFIAGKAGGVSELLVLPNCGHMPHKEKPEEVIAAVKRFLKSNLPVAAAKKGRRLGVEHL
ncbi:MAG: alpha/beta hydrolase [Desulfobacteraceae bacterium]|nr:alpha/beta hydrolase [Desulfobacteraceae bacterium]